MRSENCDTFKLSLILFIYHKPIADSKAYKSLKLCSCLQLCCWFDLSDVT